MSNEDDLAWPSALEWARLNPDGSIEYWHSTEPHRRDRQYKP